ncbi:hypothetical protein CBL_03645 [Carabus blaptoides fortunei]
MVVSHIATGLRRHCHCVRFNKTPGGGGVILALPVNFDACDRRDARKQSVTRRSTKDGVEERAEYETEYNPGRGVYVDVVDARVAVDNAEITRPSDFATTVGGAKLFIMPSLTLSSHPIKRVTVKMTKRPGEPQKPTLIPPRRSLMLTQKTTQGLGWLGGTYHHNYPPSYPLTHVSNGLDLRRQANASLLVHYGIT